ncbi:hypothetical protein NQ317_011677, partial [Molorchus minor]
EFNIVQPVVCMNCVELLENYFKFALTCASVEDKINKYCQQEGTNSNGFVNFKGVVKFSCGEGLRWMATGNETVIKKETLSNDDDSDDDDGGDFTEFDIKIEEHDLKEEMIVDLPSEPEYSLEDSKHHDKLGNEEITQKIFPDLQYKCPLCEFHSKTKAGLRNHVGIHIVEPNGETFRNAICEDQRGNSSDLNRVCLIAVSMKQNTVISKVHLQKNTSEVTTYKCSKSEYNTNCKEYLTKHSLVHKSASELTVHKCSKCEFKTKRKYALKRHSLIHKDTSELTMYKCCECEYKTKYQEYLKRHSLVHKDFSEVTIYKCSKCEFKTKYQECLKRHSLVHKDASEFTMYKCSKCEFKTKYQECLKCHSLVHKDSSEVTMYKCNKCEYRAKYRKNLKQHSLIHKDSSEVTMYKCSKCDFKTKYQELSQAAQSSSQGLFRGDNV